MTSRQPLLILGDTMGWFCNTDEAKEQMKKCEANKCPGCERCIWIEESASAMVEYGTVIVKKHPLYDKIVEKFQGKEIK